MKVAMTMPDVNTQTAAKALETATKSNASTMYPRPPSEVPLAVRAEAMAELLWREAKRDCARFISKYVFIEDRDAEGLAIPFALWPGQEEALQTFLRNRLVIILKARQLGLTWLVLSYIAWRLVFTPGYSVVALSEKEDPNAKELVRRLVFILRYLPRWMTRDKKTAGKNFYGPIWEDTTLSVTITHPDGEPSTFRAMASAPGSGRSLTASLVFLDEWAFQQWAEEIWAAVFPTVNRPTGGQVIGLSTAKRNTLFQYIWDGAKKGVNRFTRVFLPWYTDPRRDRAWYEATKSNLPNPSTMTAEYPATEEEAFSAGEGTAFQEFSEAIHVVPDFEIPLWWRRWRSNDPGYTDPFAWYCFATDEDGNVYVYREYTREEGAPRITYSDQARELVRRCYARGDDGEPTPEEFMFTVVGRDAFNRHPETGKSIVDYYREGGVGGCIEPPRDAKTDRVLRAAVLHEYLKPYFDENIGKTRAKLRIFKSCTKLIETLPKLTVDENDPDKVAECSIDHWFDAVGYGLVTWHVRQSKPPEPQKGIIAQHKEKLARRRLVHLRKRILT